MTTLALMKRGAQVAKNTGFMLNSWWPWRWKYFSGLICCLFSLLWSAIKIKDQTPFIIKFSLNLNYFPILWEAPMLPLTPHRWQCHCLQSCRWRIHRRQCHIPACLFQSLEYSKTKLICKAIIIIRKWWHLLHLKGNVALEPIEKLGAMVTRGQNRGGVAGHMDVL